MGVCLSVKMPTSCWTITKQRTACVKNHWAKISSAQRLAASGHVTQTKSAETMQSAWAIFATSEQLKTKLQAIVEYKNKVFAALYKAEPMSADDIFQKCKSVRRQAHAVYNRYNRIPTQSNCPEANRSCSRAPKAHCWIWITALFHT